MVRRKRFRRFLHEDLKIRDYIRKQLNEASVSTIEIERAANRVNVQSTQLNQVW